MSEFDEKKQNTIVVEPELQLFDELSRLGWTVATAESCTGGGIASRLTKHAGSSAYLKGSVVAYCNEVKHRVLQVDANILQKKSAVCKEVVEQMAVNVRRLMETDLGISVSGVAGPGGGTKEIPVGTIWMAAAGANRVEAKCLHLQKNREENIKTTIDEAIFFAKEFARKEK